MLEYLKGKLVEKKPAFAVVDVNGVGYKIMTSVTSYENLPNEGEDVFLWTKICFSASQGRENIEIYGFSSESERELFSLLTKVKGIGPKMALSMLSASSPERLTEAISSEEVGFLETLKGVGKKTAMRLVLELKDKILRGGSKTFTLSAAEDAVNALVTLGYARTAAYKAVASVVKQEPQIDVEDLIRKSLAKI
ncbi:Holliday junction branch migration protein RuvA [candidate division WOR-3 bacterium]|nr:Holliday junction branch migration protein RuvA [candidate division WOR-3 bacterium]